jgi:hypothetical protein
LDQTDQRLLHGDGEIVVIEAAAIAPKRIADAPQKRVALFDGRRP